MNTRHLREKVKDLEDEIRKIKIAINFMESITDVGGIDNWDTFKEMTLESIVDSCIRNGLRVTFNVEESLDGMLDDK